ncbi:MAG: hypothetical protein LBT49_06175 [Prevotellaceae bacterium]|jgi:hypothetical protein|nr:hypothetical protein [Prevotellaceae bacterium]
MKKLFLLLLCCPVVLAAQNGITISEFKVASGTVTFTVSWNKTPIDSAWVFVDYNNAGTMTRLPLSGVSASAGRAHMISGNDQGAWVVANTSGNFSATIQLLTTEVSVFTGACAYAINYPSIGRYTDVNKITFTGTPPFYLTYESDSDTVIKSEATNYKLAYPLVSFTDATRAPGTILMTATPPGAASTQTIVVGGLTWSAPLKAVLNGCSLGMGAINSSWYELNRTGCVGYKYSYMCVFQNAELLCPTPWRVPTASDYTYFRSNAGQEQNLCTNDVACLRYVYQPGCHCRDAWYSSSDSFSLYLSDEHASIHLAVSYASMSWDYRLTGHIFGAELRCVK